MDRYQQLFTNLSHQNQGAFIPFVTLGDPNPELSLRIIDTLIEAGADALELGMPFSDPLADGPTIQNANLRALKSGVTPTLCFELLAQIRAKHTKIPLGLLVYANLIYSKGIEHFYQQCQIAGVDSVLAADVPLHESDDFRRAALKHQIAPIFICPPNASEQLIEQIASHGQSYTYLLSRAGVTGADNQAYQPLKHLIDMLKHYQAPPAIQGFGISAPEQVKQALSAGCLGAISGSAVVKIIETYQQEPQLMLLKLSLFVQTMKLATQHAI